MTHTHTRNRKHNDTENTSSHRHRGAHTETHEQEPSRAAADGAPEDLMRRAEEMVDRIGQRIGHYASVAGTEILRFAARAREEVEDIWAEAQHIRRGGKV